MKEKIHPQYYAAKAHCVCGKTYEIGSTEKDLKLDICSNCHPLFTGKEKMMDIEGRVQKFKKKYAGVKVSTTKRKSKTKKKKKSAKK
ncbi:MAG: 50S ribosomal protein L31 [Candidatus Margulisbacteria bacterium]|nr:50S ribosomal protein L31 [Candidatus Margulisiibacteriota bacterium]MBU1022219.1 50S ribosomal protein L31 [Candidatus Margulisiibacteriota bacterium]MBU1729342.1 50S ribosomal protein L31 [Candidatus Margulisiibacteriota bacterium]MBU1955615.1 50S ribosomal protein L31 [Candidatus Margulisiibacteriota bacterium]